MKDCPECGLPWERDNDSCGCWNCGYELEPKLKGETMKTRIGNISAESLTIDKGGIWVDGEKVAGATYTPKSYRWEPKEDITAYELALCLPVLLISIHRLPVESQINDLPENCRRHFKEE